MGWKFAIGDRVMFGDIAAVVVCLVEAADGPKYTIANEEFKRTIAEESLSSIRASEISSAREEASIAYFKEGLLNPFGNDKWAFKLSEPIVLSLSGERGVIAGRCEYEDGSVRYSVRYLRRTPGGDTQHEGWFCATDLVKQNCVLMTTREILFEGDFWRKIFDRWELGGRKPLTDEDLDELVRREQLVTQSNH